MKEKKHYNNVMILTQDKKAAIVELDSIEDNKTGRFEFNFKITKGHLIAQEGKIYIVDFLRNYDVLKESIGSYIN